MLELRQSTSVTLKIGPFLDEDDGKTAETGLTISQADVRLSKNGGNMAQKNEASACTHDELGVYDCPADTTDTATLGRLQLYVHESGALPVWHEYMVITANEWDSKYSTDYKQVDVVQVEGTDATNQIRDAVVDDATRIDASALNTHSAITAAAIVDEWESQSQADPTGFHVNVLEVEGTDATNQIRDSVVDDATRLDASSLNAIEAKVDTVDNFLDTEIAAIKTVTDNLPDSGALNDLAAVVVHLTDVKGTGFVKDTDSLVDLAHTGADGDTLETLSDQIDAVALLGAGAETWPYTLLSDVDSSAIVGAAIWVTSDKAGNNVLASGTTNSSGVVTFYLDTGSVWVWRYKPGWNFVPNPDPETVSA